jgi:hypothetical protein
LYVVSFCDVQVEDIIECVAKYPKDYPFLGDAFGRLEDGQGDTPAPDADKA